MKINCNCGGIIFDNTDAHTTKGYIIADGHWLEFWDAVDAAIETSGSSKRAKEAACMSVRRLDFFKMIWECASCGQLYVDNAEGDLVSYTPNSKEYHGILKKK